MAVLISVIYKGIHTNEITDLYNGEYYTDSYYRGRVKAANNDCCC